MKKLLLLTVMALAGLSASSQSKSGLSVAPQAKQKVANMSQTQHSFQAVAPRQDLKTRGYAPSRGRLTLDPSKVKPVVRGQRTSVASLPALQSQPKAFSKGGKQSRRMYNLQPTMTLGSKAGSRARVARKAPAFAETYTGVGYDYRAREEVRWTMTPTKATYTDEETGEQEEADVFVGLIPTPSYLSELYPDGIPVKYTLDENDGITILPQAIAHYQNEAQDTTFYFTLFNANSDDEDGLILMEVGENGKLTITNGDWLCLGEFANVEFDEDMIDSEAYLGWDEMYAYVSYYYLIDTTIDMEYNAHGVDYFANEAVDWVLQRGTTTMDDEVTHFFVNLTPLTETFAGLYPNGIDVEYEQSNDTLRVQPQVIANIPANEETGEEAEYIMISSATADDGVIVLVEDEFGLTTIDDEAIIIGAWSTNKFDPTYGTYNGSYSYIESIKYRLPGAPAEAPEDVACEPEELVLFAGLGLSGYGYVDNLAVMGANATTTFRNCTMDIATGFEWSVKEVGDNDEEIITDNDRNFSIYTNAGAVYEDFTLTAYNEDAVSEPFTWGYGHCMVEDDDGNPTDEARYEAVHAYAGAAADDFKFTDGSYATMTRQNPDYDLTFYVNWATPDIAANYGVANMSTIYSYQGKPSTPLYLTGVTLPMVSFSVTNEVDFNLHITLYKCQRSARGTLTLGDIIAEGDAGIDNVNDQYDQGLKAVEFTELYVEDEWGMSQTVDHLFIDDEFVIVIEGWDNGTFSGVLGSQKNNFNEITSTWFQETGAERMRSYSGGWPQLFIGLLGGSYGYLYTEDDTNLLFATEGGQSSIHVYPMHYNEDEETGEASYDLQLEAAYEDGEELEELPEWISWDVANADYTKAVGTDEDGDEYEYFVNGLDYDLVIDVKPLPEGVENRACKLVFFQPGARLTVTVMQDIDPDAISTVVERTPVENSRPYNLSGQPIGKSFKGVVVKDGKKVIVK